MSTSNFQAQVTELEIELHQAEEHLSRLEKKQRQQIDDLKIEYKARFNRASSDLFRFIKFIWEADSVLLEDYTQESEDSELEGHLENAESEIKSLNMTVEKSFRDLEKRLAIGEQDLMREQERATEEGTARMGILTNKIENTQRKINQQINETENEITVSNKEKGNAEKRKSRLESDLNGMKKQLSELDTRMGVTFCTELGGFALAFLGTFVTAAFPQAGIGMIATGGSILIGGRIKTGDAIVRAKTTIRNITNTNNDIARLKEKIEALMAKLPSLNTDLNLFDGLMAKVERLAEKSNSLHRVAHKHVQNIIAAKDSVSIGGRKIMELNVHIQLGYVNTRQDLAKTLETVVEKLGQGGLQLEGPVDTVEMGEMLVMVSDIAADTDEVLAIMERV